MPTKLRSDAMRALALAMVLALSSLAHAQTITPLTVTTVARGSGAWRVILLHGYGSPPDDLVPLAETLSTRVHATFVVPGSPLPWHGDPRGRVWFDQHHDDAAREIRVARATIDALIDDQRVPEEHVIVGGFSQGAILSIEMALAGRHRHLGGIAVLSGRALDHPASAYARLAHLPVFESHGRADPLVPFARGERFVTRAREAGADVQFETFDGVHEIPARIIAALATWLAARVTS
jgi:phospholipase/carboxylesterase